MKKLAIGALVASAAVVSGALPAVAAESQGGSPSADAATTVVAPHHRPDSIRVGYTYGRTVLTNRTGKSLHVHLTFKDHNIAPDWGVLEGDNGPSDYIVAKGQDLNLQFIDYAGGYSGIVEDIYYDGSGTELAQLSYGHYTLHNVTLDSHHEWGFDLAKVLPQCDMGPS